jgi:hypothetical protein
MFSTLTWHLLANNEPKAAAKVAKDQENESFVSES